MKKIIIVGAGGFGREAYYLIKDINKVNPEWEVLGFIDDNPNALGDAKCDCPIIGNVSDWTPSEDVYFAMGISSPKTKEIIAKNMKGKGAKFTTLIHPSVPVYDYTTIGEGCIVTGLSIGDNVKIGNFVHVAGSMVGQDAVIDDYSTVTGFVNVTTSKLGKRVFVGSHSVILNGISVGDDAFICAGSIVVKNVKPGYKVFGCPAKRIDI